MLYLDDRLPTHPKILKAGARLGEGGASSALHLYMLGLTYASSHLTDGFIPCGFVSSCGVVSKSSLVANVLSARGIGLWRKVRGGYQIHDYQKHNPKAAEIKAKRERDRLRKAAARAGRNGNLSHADSPRTRARASVPVPIPIPVSARTRTLKRTSTDAPRRLALARRPEPPSFALACVVMREARQLSWQIDHDGTLANVGEHFKQLCAQRGLAYDADLVRRAYEAVVVAAITSKLA
jgi:hypothetical protein